MSVARDKGAVDKDEIVQLATFYLNMTLCGIDINRVQEINRDMTITQVPLSPDYVLGIMNLRGQIITVIDLSRKLNLKPSVIKQEGGVIIVRWQNEHIGMLVDKIEDVVEVSRQKISAPPSNIRGVQGKFFRGIIHTERNELLAMLDIEATLADE